MNINQKNIINPNQPPKGNQPGQQHNIGIDFWHAVEFSSVGHAPSHDFRHAPGQPLKPNPPSLADPNHRCHQVVFERSDLVAASVGNLYKLTHPAFPLQIALFTVR